jgi:hypothetical protein
MGADEPDDKFQFHPWSDLLKRERRELLVDDLLFTTGVTTLTAPSGEGKTTLALSIALSVDTGSWGAKTIKPRPVLWIAGEGQDDLRPMFEAWMQLHPGCAPPQGCFMDGPVDLSSDAETDALIKKLDGLPPTLIITDALADMIGDLEEDRSKDINRVYRNIWRVVRANNGSFLIPHHTGWDKDRERGSTAIRAKSDIVAHITKFDTAAGLVKLKHNKRRGGTKLAEFAFEVKLVPVPGYPQSIPIVTGVRLAGGINVDQPFRRSANAEAGLTVLRNEFPQGATWAEWLEAWQVRQTAAGRASSKATFNRVLEELGGDIDKSGRGLDVSKQGEGEGAIWRANATGAEAQSHHSNPTEPVSSQVPYRDLGEMRPVGTSIAPVSNQSHETDSTEGCGEKSTTESNIGVPPEGLKQNAAQAKDPDLVGGALKRAGKGEKG